VEAHCAIAGRKKHTEQMDGTALALYCETFARWQEAQQELSTHGLVVTTTVHDKHGNAVTVRKANPALKMQRTQSAACVLFCVSLV